MSDAGATDFVDKWLAAEPWHRLLLVFERTLQREPRRLLESVGYELRAAALDSSDPRVAATKLGWWADEWRSLAADQPRHPLIIALRSIARGTIDAQAGSAWIAAAAALAESDGDADLSARRARWQRYAQAQVVAGQAWLDARDADPRMHADALLVERALHLNIDLARGRLPVPLNALAKAGATRSQLATGEKEAQHALTAYMNELADTLVLDRSEMGQVSRYRRAQAALARVRADQLRRDPASAWTGVRPLPAWRSALNVWRVSRAP